jgi:hypothetical protein
MRRMLLMLAVVALMAAIIVANAMPAFAVKPTNNPDALPTTGNSPFISTPKEGYVETQKARTSVTHEPPTDPSGGNIGFTSNRCAGPSNNPIFGDPGC